MMAKIPKHIAAHKFIDNGRNACSICGDDWLDTRHRLIDPPLEPDAMNVPDGIDLDHQIVRMRAEFEHCKELHGDASQWAIEAGSILASLLELRDRRNIGRPHILSKDCWCNPECIDPHLDAKHTA